MYKFNPLLMTSNEQLKPSRLLSIVEMEVKVFFLRKRRLVIKKEKMFMKNPRFKKTGILLVLKAETCTHEK